MKPQTTKKLFAFFIIMMFSISYLNAQCLTCKGNHVSMYKCQRCSTCIFPDPYNLCSSGLSARICVPQSQVQKYLSEGFIICFGFARSSDKIPNKKMPNKPLAKISSD